MISHAFHGGISRTPIGLGQGIQFENPSGCHQEDSRHGKCSGQIQGPV